VTRIGQLLPSGGASGSGPVAVSFSSSAFEAHKPSTRHVLTSKTHSIQILALFRARERRLTASTSQYSGTKSSLLESQEVCVQKLAMAGMVICVAMTLMQLAPTGPNVSICTNV